MKLFSEEGEIKYNILSMFGPLSIPSSKGVIKQITFLNFEGTVAKYLCTANNKMKLL